MRVLRSGDGRRPPPVCPPLMSSSRRPTLIHWLALAGSAGLVVWWTVLPFSQDLSATALDAALRDIQWIPFVERGRPPLWSDILGNLALFTPFGFVAWRCLAGRRRRLLAVPVAALVLSAAVELVQLTLPARRTSTTDLAVDVLGALLGVGLGLLWERGWRVTTLAWVRALGRGSRSHVLVVLFALALAIWACLPGTFGPNSLWTQTQGLASSFRRFPGWGEWLRRSTHPFLLGLAFSGLLWKAGRGPHLTRSRIVLTAALLCGLTLELFQIAVPSRRPEIYQALAFGLGALPWAVLGYTPDLARQATAVGAAGLGLSLRPMGDNPDLGTRIAVAGGMALLFWGTHRHRGGHHRHATPPSWADR